MPYKINYCVVGIEWIMVVSGLKLTFNSTRWKIVNILIRILWLAFVYWRLIAAISLDVENMLIFYMNSIYTAIAIILNHHIIWSKLNLIRGFIKQILCNLDNSSLKFILYAGIAIGLTQLLLFTLYVSIYGCYYLNAVAAGTEETHFNLPIPMKFV